MRIGIDARFYGPLGKGLGRYTQKLIQYLEEIDSVNQYFIFLRRKNFDAYEPQNRNFTKVLADFQWYSFAEQVRFPFLLKKYNLNLMHFPHFNVPLLYSKPFVVTIHDLILVHFPTVKATRLNPFFYWAKFLAYRIVIHSAMKRAQKIFAVSRFTRNDIITHYALSKEKIIVTYEAGDLAEHSIIRDATALTHYGIIEPYLLYVGNAYPHKNLETLLATFYEMQKKFSELQLVLVGRDDFFYGRLKRIIARKKISGVVILSSVTDDHLRSLYANAKVFVFPSLYEGFGLPPLEAMAHSVPVVSSDHPCMREILGESAYYVDARSVTALQNGITEVFLNKQLQRSLIRKGREQVKKYHWRDMAEKTLQTYKECDRKLQIS